MRSFFDEYLPACLGLVLESRRRVFLFRVPTPESVVFTPPPNPTTRRVRHHPTNHPEEAMNVLLLAVAVAVASPPQAPALPQAPPVRVQLDDHERRLRELEAKAGIVPKPLPTAKASAPPVAQTYTLVPPGMHAHRTADGRVIVHGNENFGNAAAHAGIARPWIRIAEAGQRVPYATVRPPATFGGVFYGGGCPAGGCPR
jgi:hypothetical protein